MRICNCRNAKHTPMELLIYCHFNSLLTSWLKSHLTSEFQSHKFLWNQTSLNKGGLILSSRIHNCSWPSRASGCQMSDPLTMNAESQALQICFRPQEHSKCLISQNNRLDSPEQLLNGKVWRVKIGKLDPETGCLKADCQEELLNWMSEKRTKNWIQENL